MNSPEEIVLGPEEIAQRIVVLRGQSVLLDPKSFASGCALPLSFPTIHRP